MNCRDIEYLLLTERDGVLTNEQRNALSAHVASCPACARFRASLSTALDAYKAEAAAVPVPDSDTAWRDLQARLHGKEDKSARRRPLAPVIWFGSSLAAAAALAIAFVTTRPGPASRSETTVAAIAQPYDPSIIAGADFVEAGDPDATTMVYVDKESGWLVVWVADAGPKTSG